MQYVKPFPTRCDAEPEGDAVILNVYAHLFEASVELSALHARQLAAALIQSAEEIEGYDHA